jgi:hypothetical protein
MVTFLCCHNLAIDNITQSKVVIIPTINRTVASDRRVASLLHKPANHSKRPLSIISLFTGSKNRLSAADRGLGIRSVRQSFFTASVHDGPESLITATPHLPWPDDKAKIVLPKDAACCAKCFLCEVKDHLGSLKSGLHLLLQQSRAVHTLLPKDVHTILRTIH